MGRKRGALGKLKYPVIDGYKVCSGCKINQPIAEFSGHSKTIDGLQYQCITCGNLRSKQRHARIKAMGGYPQDKTKQFKKCTLCKKILSINNFNRDSAVKDGYDGRCAPCNRKKARLYTYYRKYGVTSEAYKQLWRKQNYKCAICKSKNPDTQYHWALDHNHKTNKSRGILCRGCNHGIGNFKDKIKSLENAIQYLKEYSLN